MNGSEQLMQSTDAVDAGCWPVSAGRGPTMFLGALEPALLDLPR